MTKTTCDRARKTLTKMERMSSRDSDAAAEMLQRAMALAVLIEPASLPDWQQKQLGKLVDEWLGLPEAQNDWVDAQRKGEAVNG